MAAREKFTVAQSLNVLLGNKRAMDGDENGFLLYTKLATQAERGFPGVLANQTVLLKACSYNLTHSLYVRRAVIFSLYVHIL